MKVEKKLASESLLKTMKTTIFNIQHLYKKLEAELDARENKFGQGGFALMLAHLFSTQLTPYNGTSLGLEVANFTVLISQKAHSCICFFFFSRDPGSWFIHANSFFFSLCLSLNKVSLCAKRMKNGQKPRRTKSEYC